MYFLSVGGSSKPDGLKTYELMNATASETQTVANCAKRRARARALDRRPDLATPFGGAVAKACHLTSHE